MFRVVRKAIETGNVVSVVGTYPMSEYGHRNATMISFNSIMAGANFPYVYVIERDDNDQS